MAFLTIEICGEENGRLIIKERMSEKHWDEPCLCEPLTARQIVDHWTAELPSLEKQANVDYIDGVWQMVKMGGTWGYPDILESFQKVEGGKWLLQGYKDVHNDVRSTLHVHAIRVIGQDGETKLLKELK